MKTEDLLREIESLPVEERARVADSVLKTLNPTESQIDEKWAEVAKRRLEEIKAGSVKPISGQEVFDDIWKRFSSWATPSTPKPKPSFGSRLIITRREKRPSGINLRWKYTRQ